MAMTNEEIFRRAGVKSAKELEREQLDAPVTRRDVRRWVYKLLIAWVAWKVANALGWHGLLF